jgi:hypothetical protein
LQIEEEIARKASGVGESGEELEDTGKSGKESGSVARWYEDEIYQKEVQKTSFWKRTWRLASIARNRRACYSSFIVMASQILCGVGVSVLYCLNGEQCKY